MKNIVLLNLRLCKFRQHIKSGKITIERRFIEWCDYKDRWTVP